MIARLLVLGLVWTALAGATYLPLRPPPPDLAPLIPTFRAPLDKPPVPPPALALPPAPLDVPPVPPAPPLVPGDKPVAPILSPRTLPCVGAWLGIASESLECGRARFQKNELDDAAKAFESAVRQGNERQLIAESRYWLGETYWRLGRVEQADALFRQVAQDQVRGELGPWALHSSGWAALRVGDATRAREAFGTLVAGPAPGTIDPWARHGLALALYALGRYEEADRVWAELEQRRPPPALVRDVEFWRGETLGRLGQHTRAEESLTRFTDGGAHPLLDTGWLRRAWWAFAGGRAAESVAPFRSYLGSASARSGTAGPERDAGDSGLALALVATGDWEAAREAAKPLEARRSPLALPVLLRLSAAAVAKNRPADAHALIQQLLAGTLPPPVRGWALLVNGEAFHIEANRDDARTQYDLARGIDGGSETGRFAALRLAQTNFDMREFGQAITDVTPLLGVPLAPDVRAAAIILQAEAAYYAGDYAAASAAYHRGLVEMPGRPEAPALRVALAWTALRQGQRDEARRQFVEFGGAAPAGDAQGVDALVLASELTLADGNLDGARELLDRVVAQAPNHPRSEFARLNRALVALRVGDAKTAQTALREWLKRAPLPELAGRAHAALGVAALQAGSLREARNEFAAAQKEGVAALPTLGQAAVALADGKLDDAAKAFTQARDDGGAAPVVAAAEYGLTAVAFAKGATGDFRRLATAALAASPRGAGAPALLYVLTGVAADAKDWPAAVTTARRLATEFRDHEAADDGLARVGAGAAAGGAWPTAYEALALLLQQYPTSPFVEDTRLAFAEAQVETGKPAEARKALEDFLAAAPADARAPQALVILARARDAAGDRAAALEAYDRAAQGGAGPSWSREAVLGHARLLTQEKRWGEARTALERLLKTAEPAVAGEAAVALGETYEGEGQHLAAVEYYMTAAYVAPDSPAGRRALLAAGKSFAALKQPDAAATVYKKLLDQPNVPADLAAAARQGLAEIRR